jgi:diguanylate cyclase (GGDEF)-like protein
MYSQTLKILQIGGLQADNSWMDQQLQAIGSQLFTLDWCETLEAAQPLLSENQHSLVVLFDNPQASFHARLPAAGCTMPVISICNSPDEAFISQTLNSGVMDCLNRQGFSAELLDRSIRYTLLRAEAEQKQRLLYLHDPLTGLPNRQQFRKNLDNSIRRAKLKNESFGMLLINLDGFKKINESFGHDTGDELVTVTAQRLSQCVRNSDKVARIGADEFTLILDDCNDSQAVEAVARKVIDVLAAPFTVNDSPFMISCSIGVALYPESGANVEELLLHAHIAMGSAKASRGSQYVIYSEEANQEALSRLSMETDLRRALRRNEFELYYQPKVDLETGDAVGVEALLRWQHPQRGLVKPDEFIPLAEESGLIVPIGYWVIQQACKDMVYLDQHYGGDIDIAINLSFKQLQDEKFVETASRIIRNSGVDASRLEFELTETAVMSNYQQTLEGMQALSKLGVTFSLDDFGTGFSSFAHIQRLPVSTLKIDQSFTRNVIDNEDDAVIVRAIINLAHSLRLKVVAEGAETLEQVQFLWHNACDQVQGFYFSPAVTMKDFCLMAHQRAMAMA